MMNASGYWAVAFGLALCAPVVVFGTLAAVPVLQPLPLSGEGDVYRARFETGIPLFTALPLLGMLLTWSAPCVTVLAQRREGRGRRRAVLGALFVLLFLPTAALSFFDLR